MKYIALVAFALSSTALEAKPWYSQGEFKPTERVMLTVTNPIESNRKGGLVVFKRSQLPILHDLHELQMTIVDPAASSNTEPSAQQRALEGPHGQVAETNGHAIPYQFDDLDGDGLWDELFFMADFAPNETRTYYVYIGMNQRGWARHRTHAGIGSYMRHTVPFWESENVGWKLWYPTDADVYAKRKPHLMSNRLYMENLDGYAVSLIDPAMGSDIMEVADSFGGGGIGLVFDIDRPDEVSRPRFTKTSVDNFNGGPLSSPRFAFSVVANGPLRSIIRIKTFNWTAMGGKYQLTQTYTAYSGQDFSSSELVFTEFTPQGKTPMLAVGIRKRPTESHNMVEDGMALSAGRELVRNPDDVEKVQPDTYVDFAGSALVIPDRFGAKYRFASSYSGNHLQIMPVKKNMKVEYYLFAGWSEGGDRSNAQQFESYVRGVRQAINNPLVNRVGGKEKSAN